MNKFLAFASLALACVIAACSQPPPSSNSHAPIVPRARFHLPAPRRILPSPPIEPDLRTPEQIAQAACLGTDGWRCAHLARKPLLAASGNQPIIPSSWTVANWYIDPANATGCASDTNSGTSVTCGTAGVGPLLTYQELGTHRWGTYSPRLKQATAITFLSSQSTTSDVVYVSPYTEGSTGNLTIIGNLGASQQICSTTLGTVTAKNRSTPQLLKTTFASCASAAAGQLIVNSTHSSHAWIYSSAGAGAWNLSQPLAPVAIPWSGTDPSEVDTWASGDAVIVYQPVTIYVGATSAVNTTPNNAGVYLDTIVVDGSLGSNPVAMGVDTYMIDSYSAGFVTAEDNIQHSTWINSWETKGILTLASSTSESEIAFKGGVYNTAVGVGYSGIFEGGTIISPGGSNNALTFASQLNDVYVDTNVTVTTLGASTANSYPGQTAPYIWGPGTLQVSGYFLVNANTAAPTLLISHVNMDSITTGCAMANSATPALACGISISGANVDSHNGYLFNPTGEAILTLSGVF